jgi:hypothetical protein
VDGFIKGRKMFKVTPVVVARRMDGKIKKYTATAAAEL